MTFVRGEKDVAYLKTRYEALKDQPLFAGIQYSEDSRVINTWAPLLMQKRRAGEPFAATRVPAGTDVDFGALTHQLFDNLRERGVEVVDEPRGPGAQAAVRRHLAASSGATRSAARPAQTRGALRLRRRGRLGAQAAAALRHPRDLGLRRLPDRRPVPQDDQSRTRRPAQGEGLLAGVGRRAADVGAAPRHARRRRRGLPAVRTVRDVQPEVPQERLDLRSRRAGAPEQPVADDEGRDRQPVADHLPRRRAAEEPREEGRQPSHLRADREGRGLGAASTPASARRS